jgi:hypothetical protein
MTERRTATVADLTRIAVEACDPDGHDPALAHLQTQLEDDDEPVTAVDNLEERLALAAEGADYEADDPAVAVATAVVLYLARHGGSRDHDRDPRRLLHLAVKATWHRDPPQRVRAWLAEREKE